MIGEVGLKPEEFWSNTLRHNDLLAKHHDKVEENHWMRTRQIEFNGYHTTFAEGKQVFKSIKKPQDLYKLPSENIKKESKTAVFDPNRAWKAYNKTKGKPKWLKQD